MLPRDAYRKGDQLVEPVCGNAESGVNDYLANKPAIPAIERDVTRVATATSSGLVAVAAIGSLAKGRLTQTVATRLAARPAFGSAAKVATRMPARRAGAIVVLALAACAPGGPWALLCSIAAGATAWVTVDETMIVIDELRFRGEMREELLATLREQKAELAAEMKTAHALYVDAMAQTLANSVNGVFLPAREGRDPD